MNSKPLMDSEETKKPGLRIALVGKTGSGKSASGNTILGRKDFKSELCPSSVTSECKKVEGEFKGQHLSVVDTPGLFDTCKPPKVVKEEIVKCISFLAPGPHVFLVVIQLGRFTEEEEATVKLIQDLFGEKSSDYTMALFTHGDDLEAEEVSVEDFIFKTPSLLKFIKQCGGRYHVFNNRSKDSSQVNELLEKINKMNDLKGGSYYTNKMLEEAEKAIREKMTELLTEKPDMEPEEARKEAEIHNKFLQMVKDLAKIGAGAGAVGGSLGAGVGAAAGVTVGAVVGLVKAIEKSCVTQ